MIMDKYALIIFDLDGTLVKSWTDELLPGVSGFFSHDDLPKLAVVSNQGGVFHFTRIRAKCKALRIQSTLYASR